MKGVRFHPDAEAEFIAAGDFYEAQAVGLGLDFVSELRHAARTVAAHPEIGHRFSNRLRRLLVRRFPYGLLYRVEPDAIFIISGDASATATRLLEGQGVTRRRPEHEGWSGPAHTGRSA